MNRSDFEIMAPVGSMASLSAAIAAGADAVYFGVGRLNMRAHSAGAFTKDDIAPIVTIAREHGVKTYLTVNTVLYDGDLEDMRSLVDTAKTAGIDAVIASDVSVLAYCRANGVRVHLSTQLNIANVEALRFYAQFADVVVLARELNLTQVKVIAEAIEKEPILGPSGQKVRIEMFAHGALCMAVSGRCYMSTLTRGRSANRGECLQTCRRNYIVKDKERDIELEVDNEYILSPKDLKTVEIIDRLIEAGVRVFKIEGRARRADYVRTVVQCYDEAISAVIGGTYSESKIQDWNERLRTVFNRGFWSGYYLGAQYPQRCRDYGACVTERKRIIGKCVRYFAKAGVGEFLLQAGDFTVGSKLLIMGPTTGAVYVIPREVLCDGVPVKEAKKSMDITFKVAERIRENDKLYAIDSVQTEGSDV